MKQCKKCGEHKPFECFAKHSKLGLQSWCRVCNAERSKQYYQANKAKHRQVCKQLREERRQWWLTFKQTLSCVTCGENHPATLDFHHIDENKEVGVAVLYSNGHSKERILEEVAKCQVLCANCHRKVHFKENLGRYHKS